MKNLTEQGYSLTAAAERSLLGISKRNCATLLVFTTQIKSIAETDREKTCELADAHIITVGAKRYRCEEELLQPSFTGKGIRNPRHFSPDEV